MSNTFNWEEFSKLNKIITLLASTSSTNEKLDILKRHADNVMLRQLLYYTYNTMLKYKITLEGLANAKALTPEEAPEGSPFDMCEKLAKSNINDRLRSSVKAYIQYNVPEDCQSLVLNMLLKDQGIHMTAKNINKSVPKLIPEFKCMLGNPIKKVKFKDGEWVAITQKMNGVRAILLNNEFKSRQGKDINGFQHIKDEIEELGNALNFNAYTMVFDGELVQLNRDNAKNDEDNFRESLSIINSKKTRTKEEELKVEYVIFDMLPTKQFSFGESAKKYKERRELLDQVQAKIDELGLEHVRVVPCLYSGAYSKEKVEDMLAMTDALELEGVMINKNATYTTKRTNNLVKVKSFFYNDVTCLGVYKGEKGKEFEDTLGGITVNYKGFNVNCGSGFNKEQRDYYINHPEEIVGKIVTVKCKGESRNSKNDDLSMNFPIFCHVREDKTEESYES